MNNGVTVDASQVLRMFSELNSRQQKNVYKNALRKAGRILQKETKTQLRSVVGKTINHKNRWDGKTLGSGIKLKVDKKATEAKVHIMGDFRLKFFELGTKTRFKKRTKGRPSTGSIKASYFFRRAREAKESEISNSMNDIITKSILRVNGQFKGR